MSKKIHTITISDLKIDTIIGVYEHERLKTQPLIFNINVDYDATKAAKTDEMDHALDYYNLCENIINLVKDNHCHLLENLINIIAKFLKSDKHILGGYIEVSKPDALKDFGALVKLSYSF